MDRPRISASFGSGQLASPTLLRGESFFFEGVGGGGVKDLASSGIVIPH